MEISTKVDIISMYLELVKHHEEALSVIQKEKWSVNLSNGLSTKKDRLLIVTNNHYSDVITLRFNNTSWIKGNSNLLDLLGIEKSKLYFKVDGMKYTINQCEVLIGLISTEYNPHGILICYTNSKYKDILTTYLNQLLPINTATIKLYSSDMEDPVTFSNLIATLLEL